MPDHQYYQEHKTELKLYGKGWRLKNPDKVKTASQRLYRKYRLNGTYPIKTRYRMGLVQSNDRGIEWHISFDEWKQFIDKPCYYCQGSLKYQIGHNLDRKDNDKGYTLDNVVPCCGNCNRIKGNILTFEEMCVAMKAVLALRGNYNSFRKLDEGDRGFSGVHY